jgi:oxygen-dependent protoporphyrinogen oxidase
MPERQRVVIVGGGITGLAAAHCLHQRRPNVQVILLEGDTRLGGKIITERVDGFVVEGGPDSFLAAKPRGLGLCRELGLGPHLNGVRGSARRASVMHGQKLYELPDGLTGLIPTRLGPVVRSGLLSPFGKARLALDLFLPPRPGMEDESLAVFTRRRLGREAYERLVEPLMSGIYAGDGEQLSLAATFPQLRQAEREHGSLIRGVLAGKPGRAPDVKHHIGFLTPANGLAELVQALQAELRQVDIRLGARVAQASPLANGYQVRLAGGEALHADALILATPAFVNAELVAGFDAELAAALRGIPYISTATVSLAYPLAQIPRPPDSHGYLIPRAEGRPLLACTFTSLKFAQRAPEEFMLIRAFVGRAGQEDVLNGSDEDLLALVRAELRRTLGISAFPVLSRVYRWPQGMPQYTLGHLGRMAQIEQRLAAHPGLYMAGNAYRGVGIPDCIASAEAAAEHVSAFLNELELQQGDYEHATVG